MFASITQRFSVRLTSTTFSSISRVKAQPLPAILTLAAFGSMTVLLAAGLRPAQAVVFTLVALIAGAVVRLGQSK